MRTVNKYINELLLSGLFTDIAPICFLRITIYKALGSWGEPSWRDTVPAFPKLMFCCDIGIKNYLHKKLLNYNLHVSDTQRKSEYTML